LEIDSKRQDSDQFVVGEEASGCDSGSALRGHLIFIVLQQ
jgi:hypothetical protein